MARTILATPTWIVAVLLILILPALVVLAQWGIRRRWPALVKGEQNDVVGFIIAVVGVIYAVLLAFVVIVAWETFDEAEGVVGQEASALRTLYRDSVGLPTESQAPMQELVRRYAHEVINDSWPAMAEGLPGDPEAGDILGEMAAVLADAPITAPAHEAFVGAEVERLNELVSLRSQRLDFVRSGIPGVLWVALIVGAVVTIGFAMLFGVQNAVLQLLMVGSLAALVGVLLFVAIGFNYPFSGDVSVQPESFERVLDDFGEPASQDADGD
jgi:hypothetical protein